MTPPGVANRCEFLRLQHGRRIPGTSRCISLRYFVIFHMLLGIPTRGWMPLGVFITCLAAIQHAQVDWRFGPLYKVFVSPRFHSYHHSVEARHANANFAFLFSFWDYLFGTAVSELEPPAKYGVAGLNMREGLTDHLVHPFRLAWRWRRGTEVTSAATSVPAANAPPTAESHLPLA